MTRLGQIAATQARAHYAPDPAARPGWADRFRLMEGTPDIIATCPLPRRGDAAERGQAPRVTTRWPGRAAETPRATTSPTRHENGVRVP
jgi:hypothetical protein